MISTQYPYIDDNEVSHDDKIKFYSDKGFQIIQIDTNRTFDYVIDIYPSIHEYIETNTFVLTDE